MDYQDLPVKRKTANPAPTPAVVIFIGSIFFLACGGVYLFDGDTVNEKELITLPPQVLYKKPTQEWEKRGKKRYYAYYFTFHENQHYRYKFEEKYVNYRSASYFIDNLEKGDTIAIQLAKQDLALHRDPYYGQKFKIFNIVKNGIPYLDHARRNEKVEKDKQKGLLVGACAFLISLALAACIHYYGKWQARRPAGSQ